MAQVRDVFHQNFDIGDTVVVGKAEDILHCKNGYDPAMLQYKEMEAVITYTDGHRYSIDVDGGRWAWCDRSLLPANLDQPDLEPAEDLFALLGGSL